MSARPASSALSSAMTLPIAAGPFAPVRAMTRRDRGLDFGVRTAAAACMFAAPPISALLGVGQVLAVAGLRLVDRVLAAA